MSMTTPQAQAKTIAAGLNAAARDIERAQRRLANEIAKRKEALDRADQAITAATKAVKRAIAEATEKFGSMIVSQIVGDEPDGESARGRRGRAKTDGTPSAGSAGSVGSAVPTAPAAQPASVPPPPVGGLGGPVERRF